MFLTPIHINNLHRINSIDYQFKCLQCFIYTYTIVIAFKFRTEFLSL